MRYHQFIYLGLSVVALAAGGCGSAPVWKRQTFAFSVPPDPPAAGPTNLCAVTRVSLSPVFQNLSFTYRTSENKYEQDPYAGFVAAPDRAIAEPIRGWLRCGGAFGHVLEPGSSLDPAMIIEPAVQELYGDLRKPSEDAGVMTIHFTVYDTAADGPGRVRFDKSFTARTPLAKRTPAALMTAWDTDLRQIMEQLNSEYAKAHPDDR